jgi:hypothetical protein
LPPTLSGFCEKPKMTKKKGNIPNINAKKIKSSLQFYSFVLNRLERLVKIIQNCLNINSPPPPGKSAVPMQKFMALRTAERTQYHTDVR